MSPAPEVIRPGAWDREAALPPLGLVPAGSFAVPQVAAAKDREAVPVHVVFPVGDAREAANLKELLAILAPLAGTVMDRVWLAFGGEREGGLARLAAGYPWVELFAARRAWPPDQDDARAGKGATMRAVLHHLICAAGVTQPGAVVQFLDADIRPAYFSPRWVLDPVGAVLWFRAVEAAKVVYHRPRGGRLNALLRAFLSQCPGEGLQSLQQLVYLLSGEIAGTLRFWTALPFKSGYGIETLTLLCLAADRLGLAPGTPDLAHVVQVYLGQMDHRHAPVASTAGRRGLDQMAANIFHCLREFFQTEGVMAGGPARPAPDLRIPLPPAAGAVPEWLTAPVGEATLAPLRTLADIQGVFPGGGRL